MKVKLDTDFVLEEKPSTYKATADVRGLRRLSVGRTAFEISFTWAQILLAVGLSFLVSSWYFGLMLVLFIGARQYALLVLLHDAQHGLLHPKKAMNDRIAEWLLAAPFGTFFSSSARLHLQHHQNLGRPDGDPDFELYCSGAPRPKISFTDLASHFLRRIVWEKFVSVTGRATKSSETQKRAGEIVPILLWQACIGAIFVAGGFWYGYFLFWLFPIVGVASFLNDFRIFSEHSNLRGQELRGMLVSYTSHPFETFLFAPFQMNYHAEHHLFPFVPHYKLPAARNLILKDAKLASSIQWRGSYWGHLVSYLRSQQNRIH